MPAAAAASTRVSMYCRDVAAMETSVAPSSRSPRPTSPPPAPHVRYPPCAPPRRARPARAHRADRDLIFRCFSLDQLFARCTCVVNVAEGGNAIAQRSERSAPRAGSRENASRNAAETAARSTKSPPTTAPGQRDLFQPLDAHPPVCPQPLLTMATRTARSPTSIPAAYRRATFKTDPLNAFLRTHVLSPARPRTEPFGRRQWKNCGQQAGCHHSAKWLT